MTEDLYIPNCCIQNQLPALLRKMEGMLAMFYSQGDWGINKLWNAVSHLVYAASNDDEDSEEASGKIRMLLVVPTIDEPIMRIVTEYYRRGWFDHLMIVAYSTVLTSETMMQYNNELDDSVHIVMGRKEAQRQSLWLRWNDFTYNALLVNGPMFTRDTNNSFGQYTATFFDAKKVKEQDKNVYVVNKRGKEMVEMVMRPWYHIANVYGKNKR